ncbi:MAG: flagellar biosynthetic protein FliO [Hyphomicrobiales bacterium]|nr:flagellar biosynthetic protein FliO [Hyphomicrobiales bacterium]
MSKIAGLAPGLWGWMEAVAVAIVVLLFILACYYAARSLLWRGISVPGGRGRQQRLGAVDVFNLDQNRQLVLVRRDNVEHLVLIGGPNDVLIESQIVRAEPRNPREREIPEAILEGANGAPRAAMPNVPPLATPPLASAVPPPVAVPVAPAPVPHATPVQRPAAFSPPPRRDPPAPAADVMPVPHDLAAPAREPADPATALMAALGSALDLKNEGAPAPSPAVPAPPVLRAPLQRPVFERTAPRPPAPRAERNVPSLASMSARQLPQPAAKTEAPSSASGEVPPPVITPSPLRPSPLNALLGNLAKAEVIPPAPAPAVAAAEAAPPSPPEAVVAAEAEAQDSLETEMARLLGRPLGGA